MRTAVIFGGTGFIGTFFAQFLIQEKGFNRVYLYDHESTHQKPFAYRRKLVDDCDQIIEILGDVRTNIDWFPEEKVDLVANFAAVHREPGHESEEYYCTNLLGADNVCSWAARVRCDEMIFTSSISPYGSSESEKDESSLPNPTTPYGGSKLASEKIHEKWLSEDSLNRNLVIVRPGVVFGPGEGGNVTRLIKAVLGHYFFYMGNKNTRKAGTYVKELCAAMYWVLELQKSSNKNFSLFNMSMNPGPSIQEYVEAVCDVANIKRTVPLVPYYLILCLAYLLEAMARPLGFKHPFSPVRIRKLVRSNNIIPRFLVDNGYSYKYSLKAAFEDWKRECPEEWK